MKKKKEVKSKEKKKRKKPTHKKITVEIEVPHGDFNRRLRALNHMVEDGRSVGEAMRKAGFSNAYSKHPEKFKKTKIFKTYKALLDHYIPDDMIAQMHKSMMTATKLEQGIFPMLMDDDLIMELLMETGCIPTKIVEMMGKKFVWYRAPDQQARKNALDMAYKCKDHYAAEKFEDVTPLRKLSNEELAQKRKELIKMLLKK